MTEPGGGGMVTAQRPESSNMPDSGKVAGGVCHRVKNDLQTIANILALGVVYAQDTERYAEAIEGRVVALSIGYTLVAEKGRPPSLDRILEMVLRRHLWRGAESVRLERQVEAIPLSLRLCSPITLWLHEIIGNSLRHGLEQVSDPVLSLKASLDDDGLCLRVRDNGCGLPPGFDLDRHSRLGLRLARAVCATDLRGNLELNDAQPGVEAVLRVSAREFANLGREVWW